MPGEKAGQDLVLLAVKLRVIGDREWPPYSFNREGQATGCDVEIARAVLARLGRSEPVELLPWSRAYALALERPDVILLSTARSKKRERMFKWVGPLGEHTICFFARKGDGVTINSLDDARGVARIGVVKEYVEDQMLREKGFTNLFPTTKAESNPKNLLAGRIDLWLTSDGVGQYIARRAGVNPQMLERVYVLEHQPTYIAVSKGTADTVAEAWQRALDALKADGTYARIRGRWLQGVAKAAAR